MKPEENSMLYPVGEQSFEKIRKVGYIYVDKTAYVYKLANPGGFFFLSRPRRFGKSLLVSTMEAYFLGKKDLFTGLEIEKLENDWTEYQVLHLDFSGGSYAIDGRLERILNTTLCDWEEIYGNKPQEDVFETRFKGIIRRAYEKDKRQVVILVDEYDKPLLDVIDKPELHEKNRVILGGLYEVLKSQSEYIRFAFLTGVSKFSKVSIFSGLNNLKDITLVNAYADICGITEAELLQYFDDGIKKLARAKGMTVEEACMELERKYDGYMFAEDCTRVYNPFSLLNALQDSDFHNWWYEAGTPSFLVKLVKDSGLKLGDMLGEIKAGDLTLKDSMLSSNIYQALYQSGYLTIKGKSRGAYVLGFPNGEVAESFMTFFLALRTGKDEDRTKVFIKGFIDDVENCRVDDFIESLKTMNAKFGYDVPVNTEGRFQLIFGTVFTAGGFRTELEDHTNCGRIDVTVEATKYIYVIELKLDKSVGEAMEQIERKDYSRKFHFDKKKIIRIGVNCSKKDRQIESWTVEAEQ